MKRRCFFTGVWLLQVTAMCLFMAVIGQAQVRIINMIPKTLSNETQRDSEPNVAVNPANPMQIAGSAFTPDPMASGAGPIFVSTDGGNTWALNVILPGGDRTGDVTMRFARTSNVLYLGILRFDNSNMNILRIQNFLTPGVLAPLVNRANEDQPYVQAETVPMGPGAGNDRVFVGHNDFNAPGNRTATVEGSLDAATTPAPAGFNPLRINPRTNCGQDGPGIRTAIHSSGVVYAVYYRWTTCPSGGTTGTGATTDVVVARDDNWGGGGAPFTALIDSGDTMAGVRVVTGVALPPFGSTLGTQRVGGSNITIAVDPNNNQTVYIAWADGATAAGQTLHVRRSTNGGVTWSADLRTIASATNPALAINSIGKVGFLYQRLTGTAPNQRWETHLELTADGFATAPTDFPMANVPDQNGAYTGTNPIGDYLHLMTFDRDFYGVFSANNTPNMANFPNSVTYQRNANFTTNTLLGVDNMTSVGVSIDPFFFLVKDQSADLAITKIDSPDPVVTGSNITYTITVKNNGPTDASSVTVNDNLPGATSSVSCSVSGVAGGVCGGSGNNRTITFPTFPANATATIMLTAKVECSVVDGATIGNTATVSSTTPDPNPANNTAMTTTMASNPAPVITCPKDQIAVAPKPGDTSAIVTYPAPTVTDNCPGATVVCSPPSGSVFPLGTTAVNCIATDTGGRTASCSFKVTVFDVCLQDNASGDSLVFNSFTGEYLFTRCATGFKLAGIGMITRTGCLTKLMDAKVEALLDRCVIAPLNRGSATIKPNPIGGWFYINDTNTANNTCMCP